MIRILLAWAAAFSAISAVLGGGLVHP